MHIFLVNDDGIGAKGIMALYRAAVARGHRVSMCAPRFQQSAASHRVSLEDPIYVEPYALDAEGCEGFAVYGSPGDCVRLGLQNLVTDPVDVVISGINEGCNGGASTHYSGTVGAAMEGAFHGVPAIASSVHYQAIPEMYDHLAVYTIEMAEKYVQAHPIPNTVLNINAPCLLPHELKGTVYAPLDMGNYTDRYEKRVSPRGKTYYWMGNDGTVEPPKEGTDMYFVKQGYIALTIIGTFISAGEDAWKALNMDPSTEGR